MKRKTTGILGFAAIAALIAVLSVLSGCQPADESESIRDVIDNFIAAVNDDDSFALKDTLDPDADAYSAALVPEYWDAFFDAKPYTISSYSDSDNTATVTFSSDTGADKEYTFDMTEDGDSYNIRRIRTTSDMVAFFQ